MQNILLLILSTVLLTSCGGGGGGGGGNNGDGAGTTRILTDAPINGVSYECDGITRITSNGGEFTCQNAPVTFKIGTLELGEITGFAADNKVFPQDLAGTTRDDITGKALRIARLLQSLDDDGIITDTINIPSDVAGSFTSTGLNFDTDTDANLQALFNLFGGSRGLIGADEAVSNLRSNMYSVLITLSNADNTTTLINAAVTLNFSGADIINNLGRQISQITLPAGTSKTLSVFLINDPTSTEELRITTRANGFLDSGSSAILSPERRIYEVNLNLVSSGVGLAAPGIMVANMDVSSQINSAGMTTEAITITNQENANAPEISVTIPEGTMLTDGNGDPVVGTMLSVTSFDPTESQALAAYPGGLDVMAEVGGDGLIINGNTQAVGTEAQVSFKSVGFAAITITDEQGNKVRNFSEPVEIAMQFPIDTTDGELNIINIDDTVPIWSYDEDTSKWTFETQGRVTDQDTADSLYDVIYEVTHLSYYNLDYTIDNCQRSRFNFVDGLGNTDYTAYNTALDVQGIDNENRWSERDNRAFVDIRFAPEEVPGTLEIFIRSPLGDNGQLVATETFSNLCSPIDRDIITRLARRTVNAGADKSITSDTDSTVDAQVATYDNACDATLTYTSSNESVATVASDTGVITIFGAGTTTITATAAASTKCEAASDGYELEVNLNPIANSPVSATVNEDDSGSFSFSASPSASDTTGNILTWSLGIPADNGVASVSGIGATPTIAYIPNNNYNGQDTFTALVSDNFGGSTTVIINVTVNPVNDAPIFTSTPITSATEDSAYSYTTTASDIDDSGNLSFSVTTPPSWLSFNGTTLTLSGTPSNDDVGSHSVTIQVSDGTITTEQSFTIIVSNTNDVPIIVQGESVSINMSEDGSPTPFVAPTITATDVDTNDVPTLSWSLASGASNGTASVSGTGASPSISYTPNLNYYGSDSFIVQVTDNNGGNDSIVVTVNIIAVDDAPTISRGAILTASVGNAYTLMINANDVEGDALSFSIQNSPSWASFNTITGELTGTPSNSHAGSFDNIVISVTANGATTSLSAFSITVSENPPDPARWNNFNWDDGSLWQ